MNLHSDIMNIQPTIIHDGPNGVGNVNSNRFLAYKEGHRDARHAAAELSLKADARIEELESVLKGLLNEAHTETKPLHPHSEWSIKAMKVLENK